jgi:zinc and cadmium transporter
VDVAVGVWLQTIAALVVVSALSLVGASVVALTREALQRILFLLISFAAGALLGDAFIHIVPEIAESDLGFDTTASMGLLSGVIAFFILEKVLHWHHAHLPHEEVLHPVAVSNLVGDALHNFVDGAIIAGAFVTSPEIGVATTVAVALHEIPQELGDFGILVHAGLAPRRALMLNFATGLAAVAGGVLTLMLASVAGVERYLLPFTAGAFVYIASTDLFPELHKEPEPGKSLIQVIAVVGGVGVMALLLLLE